MYSHHLYTKPTVNTKAQSKRASVDVPFQASKESPKKTQWEVISLESGL